MRVIIVEDEPLAAAQLAALIADLRPEAKIEDVCDTVKSAVEWIEQNPAPDLAFFDVQLGDGLSFEIFNKTEFNVPVVFTTAYEQYAIQAFKANGIDYILKPIDKKELEESIRRYEQKGSFKSIDSGTDLIHQIVDAMKVKKYKERFMVKVGSNLHLVDTSDIAYFYSFEKATYIKTMNGTNSLIDQSLEQVEQLINPKRFFRINRKYLVALPAIKKVSIYGHSRLKLKMEPQMDDDFFVAREKVKSFKTWFEGE